MYGSRKKKTVTKSKLIMDVATGYKSLVVVLALVCTQLACEYNIRFSVCIFVRLG